MMKKCLSFLACGLIGAIALAEPAWAGPARLIINGGAVSIRRAGWSQFSRAGNGTQLGGTDLIRPAAGANASLRCPNGGSRRVSGGSVVSVNNLCGGRSGSIRSGDVLKRLQLPDSIGGDDVSIPYIIAPRSGLLFNANPRFQWNPVADATRYTITLVCEEGCDALEPEAIWRGESETPQLTYPEDAPALQADAFYHLEVIADTGQSSTDAATEDVSFLVLPLEDSVTISEDAELPPELLVFDQATLLLENEYYADAIALLQDQITQTPTPALYQKLAELYLATGLRLLGEQAYAEAIALAGPDDSAEYADLEVWLASHYGLAQLYAEVNETEAAIAQLQAAEKVAALFCANLWLNGIQKKLSQWGTSSDSDATASCSA
ncbi:MAG: hypothetical protein F6J87_22050 [Spirulina sp. SIO3F2]|nr:hypothetical protein [Spirulina sp. SIO3F2]